MAIKINIEFDTEFRKHCASIQSIQELTHSNVTVKTLNFEGQQLPVFPGNHKVITESFDYIFGYLNANKACKLAFGDNPIPNITSAVSEVGFSKHQFIDKELADKLLLLLKQRETDSLNTGSFLTSLFALNDDPHLCFELMATIFRGQVRNEIEHYFQSHFMPYYINAWRTLPKNLCDLGDRDDISYRWHCDSGPSRMLKILFYLNDFDEHQGGTLLMDLHRTRRLSEFGYTGCPINHRRENLDAILNHLGEPQQPTEFHAQAGQGFLFQNTNVLHKGMAPTRGPRFAIQIGLIPSPAPWQAAFKNLQNKLLANRKNLLPAWRMAD